MVQVVCADGIDWAAWVQAVGSVGAIAFAFFAGRSSFTKQVQKEQTQSRLEAERICRVLAAEMRLVARRLEYWEVERAYRSMAEDLPYRRTLTVVRRFPVETSLTPVFDVIGGNLGMVPDDLIDGVIDVYGQTKYLVDVLKLDDRTLAGRLANADAVHHEMRYLIARADEFRDLTNRCVVVADRLCPRNAEV